jgi:hypothetical protein
VKSAGRVRPAALLKWVIVALFAAQLVVAAPHLENTVATMLVAPNLTYPDKMYVQWRDVYVLLDFVRRETPPTAVILMNQDDRPEFDQYFLFPRRVIYGNAGALAGNPQITYVLITDHYPEFAVVGHKIMMDDVHGLYRLEK